MKALEIERRRQQVPFGGDLSAASEQESSGAVPLFEEAKDRLDYRTSAAVELPGRYGRHQLPVPLQYRLVLADLMERPFSEEVHLPKAGQTMQSWLLAT